MSPKQTQVSHHEKQVPPVITNSPIRVQPNEPLNKFVGMIWYDTGGSEQNDLKVWTGTEWTTRSFDGVVPVCLWAAGPTPFAFS